MAATFSAKVYTQRAQARLVKFQKQIEKAGQQTVQDLVNIGKEQARVLVPKGKTGWLYKSIRGKVLGGPNPRGQIFLDPKILPVDGVHRYSEGKYPQFNLSRWMHTSPRAQHHFRSGDSQFMYTTGRILNERKKKIAEGNYNKLTINNR